MLIHTQHTLFIRLFLTGGHHEINVKETRRGIEREELIFYSQSQQLKRKLGLKKRKLCNDVIKEWIRDSRNMGEKIRDSESREDWISEVRR